MNSMTRYGRGCAANEQLEIAVELSSVNRRYLEVSVSAPRDWAMLEQVIASRVRQSVKRGKIHVVIQSQGEQAGSNGFSWNKVALEQALSGLRDLTEELAIPFNPDVHLIIDLARRFESAEQTIAVDQVLPLVEQAVDQGLTQLVAMRQAEGAALAADLQKRMSLLAGWRDEIEKESCGLVASYGESLLQRLQQTGLELNLEDERVLKEIALFADRCDISEELTRLDSHLDQFAHNLSAGSVVGRKLEFLLQEINREFNTVGSKANSFEITRRVIECKSEIERVREQLQNVE